MPDTRNTTNILRLPAVIARTGLSRSSLYKRISENTFPPPRSLGGRAVGFFESDVDDWLNKLATKSKANSGACLDGARQ